MATLGQAVTVFEEDTLVLRFTFNDLTVDFDNQWGAWIAFCANTDFLNGGSSTIQRSKATSGWTYAAGSPTETGQVAVIQNSNVVEVYFDQEDFAQTTTLTKLTGGTDYYFELVVADNHDESRSIVAATGIFTVNESLFTVNGFRP